MLRARSFLALAALLFVAFLAVAPAASAQTDDPQYPLTTTPPTVLDQSFQQGDPPPQVLSAGTSAGTSLPVTGSDVVGLTVLGLVAVGAGFALVRYQRSAADRV